MPIEIDLESQAFPPGAVQSLGSRDKPESLRSVYADASAQGIKGTLLPHSLPGGAGGSMGFDASKPMPFMVDPDIPGQSYMVNPGDISSKSGEQPRTRMPAGGYNEEVVRKVASKAMREAMSQSSNAMPEKEEPMAKKRAPRTKAAASAAAPVEGVQKEAAPAEHIASLPTTAIEFDFGAPMGTLEARYHDIFREGNRLVLAWDLDCTTASRYRPSKMVTPLTVVVGSEKERYSVLSLGLEFTDETTRRMYIVLLIDMREQADG